MAIAVSTSTVAILYRERQTSLGPASKRVSGRVRSGRIGCSSLIAFTAFLPGAYAAEFYASPSGSGSTCSQTSPCSLNTAAGKPAAGDTVYLASGTYTGLRPSRSGTASAWITFAAAAGALPIIEGGNVGGGSIQYVRFVGIASRNGASGGFGNGWTDGNCSTMSNGNLEYINCIADGNGINGIAHYCAGGVHVKQSIVLHNGNKDPSWSSGVNLFAVQGGASSNVVEQTISFENIDISSHHSDGSGFIADQNSTGATFINNIGFRNGGSCIRVTNSTNTQIINNTCVNNGLDPTALYHDEIFFSDTSKTHQGALLRNNLCIPTSGQNGLTMGSGVPAQNNIFNGTPSLVVSATGDLDFRLVQGASAIDAGASGAPTPSDDIGFDWRCIKSQTGQTVPWWNYAVDYDYIAQIGGIAKCFSPKVRSGVPDVGAYEYNGTSSGGGSNAGGGNALGTGGTASAGQANGGVGAALGGTFSAGGSGGRSNATGGVTAEVGGASTSRGGAESNGGSSSLGGATASGTGGNPPIGGSGTEARGGASATGGVAAKGGNSIASAGLTATGGTTPAPTNGDPDVGGCTCRTTRAQNGYGAVGFAVCLGLLLRRRRRALT